MYGCNNVEAGSDSFIAPVSRILQLVKHIDFYAVDRLCSQHQHLGVFHLSPPRQQQVVVSLFGSWS